MRNAIEWNHLKSKLLLKNFISYLKLVAYRCVCSSVDCKVLVNQRGIQRKGFFLSRGHNNSERYNICMPLGWTGSISHAYIFLDKKPQPLDVDHGTVFYLTC